MERVESSPQAGTERSGIPSDVERVMGIEPTRPAWKAGILPLNYTRMDGRIRNISLDMIAQTSGLVNRRKTLNRELFTAARHRRRSSPRPPPFSPAAADSAPSG